MIELFDIIKGVASIENDNLRENFNKGIFFMPELAFSYECGKALKIRHSSLSKDEFELYRELKLENGGISDIVFKSNSTTVVVEFKMDDKIGAYIKDIQKLQKLPFSYERYFCSIKHVFAVQVDEFLKDMKRNFAARVELIDYSSLHTIVGEHSRLEDRALLSLWKVV